MTFLFFGLGSSQPASQPAAATDLQLHHLLLLLHLLLLFLLLLILNKMHVIHLSLHTANTHICVNVGGITLLHMAAAAAAAFEQ